VSSFRRYIDVRPPFPARPRSNAAPRCRTVLARRACLLADADVCYGDAQVFGWENIAPAVYLVCGLSFAALSAMWHEGGAARNSARCAPRAAPPALF